MLFRSAVNQELPQYAQIHHYVVLEEAFTFSNQQLTENGRLKRDVIESHYGDVIDSMYSRSKDLSVA